MKAELKNPGERLGLKEEQIKKLIQYKHNN